MTARSRLSDDEDDEERAIQQGLNLATRRAGGEDDRPLFSSPEPRPSRDADDALMMRSRRQQIASQDSRDRDAPGGALSRSRSPQRAVSDQHHASPRRGSQGTPQRLDELAPPPGSSSKPAHSRQVVLTSSPAKLPMVPAVPPHEASAKETQAPASASQTGVAVTASRVAVPPTAKKRPGKTIPPEGRRAKASVSDEVAGQQSRSSSTASLRKKAKTALDVIAKKPRRGTSGKAADVVVEPIPKEEAAMLPPPPPSHTRPRWRANVLSSDLVTSRAANADGIQAAQRKVLPRILEIEEHARFKVKWGSAAASNGAVLLGSGSFGAVTLAMDLQSGLLVARKAHQ